MSERTNFPKKRVGYKPAGIRRKHAHALPSWKEKFELCARGELYDERVTVLIEWLHQVRSENFPETTKRRKAMLDEFVELATKAATNLDDTFFTQCLQSVLWISAGKPLADPLGDHIMRVLIKIARMKGAGDTITWAEVFVELEHQHPKDEVYDDTTVRKAAAALKLGRFPLSTDTVLAEYRNIFAP
jgi:hypothetical protein